MKTRIYHEIQHIDLLIKTHDLLLNLCRERDPNSTELAAAGAILYSFYNSVERIFLDIIEDFNREIPDENKFHQKILRQMNAATQIREKIISDENYAVLKKYLIFRQAFHDSHEVLPEWNAMKDIFVFLKVNWSLIKKDILNYVEKS